jgi:hypothetical protein
MLAKHSFERSNGAAWQYRVLSVDPGAANDGPGRMGWCERERRIELAVAALARLDDRTLLDLGIFHRTHIEWTVRYCHDC